MYESPINKILGEMQITYENECLKVVQSYGFDVNKEELTKALQYDREQYSKGYSEGRINSITEFEERLAVRINENYFFAGEFKNWTLNLIEEIASEMRGAE